MAKMSVTVQHNLPAHVALERIKGLLPRVKAEQAQHVTDLEETWTENEGVFSFRAKGFKVSGKLVVRDGAVALDGEIPWVVVPLKGIIERTIREEAAKILA